jgi:hypothetical protein
MTTQHLKATLTSSTPTNLTSIHLVLHKHKTDTSTRTAEPIAQYALHKLSNAVAKDATATAHDSTTTTAATATVPAAATTTAASSIAISTAPTISSVSLISRFQSPAILSGTVDGAGKAESETSDDAASRATTHTEGSGCGGVDEPAGCGQAKDFKALNMAVVVVNGHPARGAEASFLLGMRGGVSFRGVCAGGVVGRSGKCGFGRNGGLVSVKNVILVSRSQSTINHITNPTLRKTKSPCS